ncbi:MAG: nitroreductase family protein, partial [Paludibacter sp.]|nr:nitroreductase family protein [Paludibacter sp.]
MNFSELIKIRRSNRAYENRAVEREKIEQVLEAGRLAPSANN